MVKERFSSVFLIVVTAFYRNSQAQLVYHILYRQKGTCRIDSIIASTETVAGKIKLLKPNLGRCTATQKLRPGKGQWLRYLFIYLFRRRKRVLSDLPLTTGTGINTHRVPGNWNYMVPGTRVPGTGAHQVTVPGTGTRYGRYQVPDMYQQRQSAVIQIGFFVVLIITITKKEK